MISLLIPLPAIVCQGIQTGDIYLIFAIKSCLSSYTNYELNAFIPANHGTVKDVTQIERIKGGVKTYRQTPSRFQSKENTGTHHSGPV
jgi:hypothetical protein